MTTQPSSADIEAWLRRRLAEETGRAEGEVDATAPFADLGLSSMQVAHVVGDLEEWLGENVSVTALWDHPTIESLAAALASLAPGEGGGAAGEVDD